MTNRLCSACLLGIKCRYDGASKSNKKVIQLANKWTLVPVFPKDIFVPVCPEQLGGLPTPREAAEQRGSRVLTSSGKDVTENFLRGAKQVLRLAKLLDIKEAIFKQRSPSCGCGQIYDGTFSGNIKEGDGITTALLKKNGIRVISEEDL